MCFSQKFHSDLQTNMPCQTALSLRKTVQSGTQSRDPEMFFLNLANAAFNVKLSKKKKN